MHLKTDSRFLYEYSLATARANGLTVLCADTDIYRHAEVSDRHSGLAPESFPPDLLTVQTFYEKMFLEMGLPITYMAFTLEHQGAFIGPGEAFDHDHWLQEEGPRRSFSHQPNKKQ